MMKRLVSFAFVAAIAAALVSAPLRAHAESEVSAESLPVRPVTFLQIDLRAGLDRQPESENGIAALDARLLARTPVEVSGLSLPLEDAIRSEGGALNIHVHDDRVAIELAGLPDAMPRLVTVLATAMNAPDFSLTAVTAARKALLARIAERQQNNWELATEMLRRSLARSGNLAMPRDGTPFSVQHLSIAQARAFYLWNYRRGDIARTIVGERAPGLDAALARVAEALPGGRSPSVSSPALVLDAATLVLSTTRPTLSTMIVASFLAPKPTSADFPAMLVEATLMKRILAETAGLPKGLDAFYLSRSYGARYRSLAGRPQLLLYASGAVGRPDQLIGGALALSQMIGSGKLHGSIDRLKSQAIGDFARQESDPRARLRLLRIFREAGGTGDPVAKTIAAIANVTPADLARVAKRYLVHPTIAVVQGSDGSGS
uniref:Peptidase M16 N-terminal domain-containing protein n=1 Tax=mine drainage metagenome TaxID=410659 RepID=E6PID7_9ZZZZ